MRIASTLVLLGALTACGDDGAVVVDASIDSPPIDAAPDGPTCAAPSKVCGSECTPVDSDEENCGDCGVECQGGAACQGTCTCPPAFVGSTLTASQLDQFQNAGGITLAINPNIDGQINPFIVGFTATTPRNMAIDLSTITLGEAPFVAVGYGFDIQSNNIDAAYVATAGTLTITQACSNHIEGTLTNATFRGIDGGFTNPMIDPQGCTFSVASVAFAMGQAACP